MEDEARTCLMCGGVIAAGDTECRNCKPLEVSNPVEASTRTGYRGAMTHGPQMQGVSIGLAMIVGGVVLFVVVWMSGRIWPWAFILSLAGIGVMARGLEQKKTQGHARKRYQRRSGRRR